MNQPRILVIDDDNDILELCAKFLRSKNYNVVCTTSPQKALEELLSDHTYSIVVTDLVLPDMDGIELLKQLKEKGCDVSVIMMTSYGSIENAVLAMREGARDFITKPFSRELFLHRIERELEQRRLHTEVERLREELGHKHNFGNLIGANPRMRKVYELISAVARTDATVLILGETGTGKELVARAIHYSSARSSRPFVKVDCAALTETLLESELFGHEKGAYTGAYRSRAGRFELAHTGTLFLDEVSNIPLSIQAKLLRVLQDHEFERVGGEKLIKVNVRILAATNADLDSAVLRGTFRRDLYYRLNVITIELPPLRDRKEDIPLLANHFISIYASKNNKKISSISKEAIDKLMDWDWPGNVRELENCVERAVVLCTNDELKPSDILLPSTSRAVLRNPRTLKEAISETERRVIIRALEESDGDISRACKRLEISRATLYNKIKKYDIQTREPLSGRDEFRL